MNKKENSVALLIGYTLFCYLTKLYFLFLLVKSVNPTYELWFFFWLQLPVMLGMVVAENKINKLLKELDNERSK